MQQHALTQGSAEWLSHRAKFFNASDAPAMLGISPYKTRDQLLQEKATGITPEISPQQQRVFNRGHELEILARPIAEEIVGEELFPVVGSSGELAASFDGLTMLGDVAFEHKTLNQSLRYDWDPGNGWHLPEHYQAQMEQQLMVSGAERVLFMASEQDDSGELVYKHCWYASDPKMRQRIVAGWAQFKADLAAWQPTKAAAPVQAAPVESLPAVVVQVQGALTVDGNLPAFGNALRGFIERIPTRPATDQEFADCDAACKALKKAEDALEHAESSALAQISDVELMRRTVADLRNLARSTRLTTEKLVRAEKEARKTAKVAGARHAFETHVQRLQLDVPGITLRVEVPEFAAAIKGLSSLASIDEKLTAALLEGKARADSVLLRVKDNIALIDANREMLHLFADRQELAHKDAEVVALTVQQRIETFKRQQEERLEAERQRIRAEEEAKAQAQAERERVARELAEQREREAAQREADAEAERKSRESAAQWANERRWHEMHGPRLDCDARGEQDAKPADAERGVAELAMKDSAPPTLKLGEINRRIAPLSITADGLKQLGFEPGGHERRAVLYHEADFNHMRHAMVALLQKAQA